MEGGIAGPSRCCALFPLESRKGGSCNTQDNTPPGAVFGADFLQQFP